MLASACSRLQPASSPLRHLAAALAAATGLTRGVHCSAGGLMHLGAASTSAAAAAGDAAAEQPSTSTSSRPAAAAAREQMSYDVLIVGAGPAGLSAALHLKKVCAGVGVPLCLPGDVHTEQACSCVMHHVCTMHACKLIQCACTRGGLPSPCLPHMPRGSRAATGRMHATRAAGPASHAMYRQPPNPQPAPRPPGPLTRPGTWGPGTWLCHVVVCVEVQGGGQRDQRVRRGKGGGSG